MLEMRVATKEDVEQFYGKDPEFTFKGFTGVQDGEIMGVCGVYFIQGIAVVFSEIKEGISKKLVVMGIRKIMELADSLPYKVYATTETSQHLLIKLGFRETTIRGVIGRVYERVK